MENMKINQLPSKTWNWLKMNETAVSGISVSGAHEGNLEIPEGIKKTVCPAGLPDRFKDVAGGMGSDMDMLVKESSAPVQYCSLLTAMSPGTPARIRFAYGAFEHSLNTFGILAKEGSNMTVIMDMAAERNGAPDGTGTTAGENPAAVSQSEHTGLSAVQTKLILEKDAEGDSRPDHPHQDNAKTVLNDIGAKVADGAKLSVIHLFLWRRSGLQRL